MGCDNVVSAPSVAHGMAFRSNALIETMMDIQIVRHRKRLTFPVPDIVSPSAQTQAI